MDAAQTIRHAVARVSSIRSNGLSVGSIGIAVKAVKAFQAKRFSGTYTDLLASSEFGPAANFFLQDLYSDRDYSQRDSQFSRIAGALQALFPHQVVETAVSLAQLHLLTEELDAQMAAVWVADSLHPHEEDVVRYASCWRQVGRTADRTRQLEMVLRVGSDLVRLTRTPGLRLMLRMMRRPAIAAGLGSLQSFLETGFDTFASMSSQETRTIEFLDTIKQRETHWIEMLSSGEIQRCRDELEACVTSSEVL